MEDNKKAGKFAGIEVPPDLTKGNFFFLYANTLLIGMLMVMPAIIQPAFLKDAIRVPPDFFGLTNGFLQNMSQIATLLFVGVIGYMSDKTGRKILAIAGFAAAIVFYYLLGLSNEIAAVLNISPDFSSKVCAFLSFAPSRSGEFLAFGPGLFVAYVIRLLLGIGLILVYPQFITMVADYTYDKDRGKGMALNGIMMGLASIIIFAAIAPIGRKSGVQGLFIVASGMALAGLVCTLFFLKERLPETKQEDRKGIKELARLVLQSPALKSSYLCSLISRADITVMATFIIAWAVQLADKLQLTSEAATQKGAVPMIIMSVVTFIAFPFVGIMLDKWGRLSTIMLTLAAGGIGLLIIACGSGPFAGMTYGAVVLVGFGIAGSIAGANTMATDVSPKALVGSILGGLNTMQPIGMLFFLQLGGYLFDVLGPGWAFGLKGAANLVLAVWLFMARKSINNELAERKAISR
ncbi:MAG: MFS transporter [Deltaproteobacteria bacterium]|nr:MFS transporter [Deltaproteobacteria bacterium]